MYEHIPFTLLPVLLDKFVARCVCVHDLCYALAKYYVGYYPQPKIRLGTLGNLEVLQTNGHWTYIGGYDLTSLVFNREFVQMLFNEGIHSQFYQELCGVSQETLVTILTNGFLYHLSHAITGPFVYFVSIYNDGFEPVTHVIGSSRDMNISNLVTNVAQAENSICNLHAVIVCPYPENVVTHLAQLLDHRRLGSKFQVTRQDINESCRQLSLWPYLKVVS